MPPNLCMPKRFVGLIGDAKICMLGHIYRAQCQNRGEARAKEHGARKMGEQRKSNRHGEKGGDTSHGQKSMLT